MTKRRKHKTAKKGLNRKLVCGVVLVTIILLTASIVYYLFFLPHTETWTAAIIDQLTVQDELANPTFNANCTSMLEAVGFDVKYYSGKDVTVNFYKDLPLKGNKVIILRVHSAVRNDSDFVDLFTSELFVEGKYSAYGDQISKAKFLIPPHHEYFAIGPTFVHNPINPAMKGTFADSVIIMMGCASLNKTTMAEAFVSRGAKVVIGWTRLVLLDDSDESTMQLLKYLLERELNIEDAVNKVNQDPPYRAFGTTLDYYPKTARNYKIPTKKNDASLNLMSEPLQFLLLTTPAKWKRIERVAF